MDTALQKKKLRNKMKNSALSGEYIRTASDDICRRVLESREYQSAGIVFCYVSTPDEPDTRPILLSALSQGKTLLVPRCIGGGRMETVEIRSLSELSVGSYGILEPLSHIMSTDIVPELSMIPCVCCDRDKNRLGHGGGYYDRFFERGGGFSAVLCFDERIVDFVPTESHDFVPNAVVTEKRIYI